MTNYQLQLCEALDELSAREARAIFRIETASGKEIDVMRGDAAETFWMNGKPMGYMAVYDWMSTN